MVATPIGNLGDAAPRMADLLGRVSCIFAEDTRRTRRLLSHLGIRTRLLSLHGNSPESAWRAALDRLSEGDVAYVSDAGTPAVSDPGARLVALAHQHGIAVHSIPGPSAVTAALSVSGLESGGHVFLGFLPERKTRRLELLDAAVSTKLPLVVFLWTTRRARNPGRIGRGPGTRYRRDDLPRADQVQRENGPHPPGQRPRTWK